MQSLNYFNFTPDEYMLAVVRARARVTRQSPSKKQLVMAAQQNAQDFELYLEGFTPLPATGVVTTVLSYVVPQGFCAIITDVRHVWTGSGFVNGSGDLVWNYFVGGGSMFGYADVKFMTSLSQNGTRVVGQGGYIIYENQSFLQTVTAGVNAAANLTGGQVEGVVKGWLMPADTF